MKSNLKYKTYILTFSLMMMGLFAFGQGVSDAVRWSTFNAGGTARTIGVGGAFGAMGGDYGSLSINPAGLGEYKRSEFLFSPSLNLTDNSAYFLDDPSQTTLRDGSNLQVDNIALVISRSPRRSDWYNSNFSIGFNKIADLNKTFSLNGTTTGSIVDRFVEQANGLTIDQLDEFEAWPAASTLAIFDIGEDLQYESDFLPGDQVQKAQLVTQTGYINELSFGWSGNMKNKINFGASLGVPFVSFEENKSYAESDPNDEIPAFNNLAYNEYVNTTGAGLNLKAGFIYKAGKTLRIGGAIHSPTWYTLNDDYYTSMDYSFTTDNGTESYTQDSEPGSFKYDLNTPWKLIGSVGTIYKLGKLKGFIDADVEFLDYASNSFDFTKFSSDPGEAQYTNEINGDIDTQLGRAVNWRIGTELAYNTIRFRVGYAQNKSPFVGDDASMGSTSFGLGLREDKFFLDLGVQTRTIKEGYIPYLVNDSANDPVANIVTDKTRLILTAGFKI